MNMVFLLVMVCILLLVYYIKVYPLPISILVQFNYMVLDRILDKINLGKVNIGIESYDFVFKRNKIKFSINDSSEYKVLINNTMMIGTQEEMKTLYKKLNKNMLKHCK